MKTLAWSALAPSERAQALERPTLQRSSELAATVREILAAVRAGGDKALLDFTERFDGVRPRSLRVGRDEVEAAMRQVAPAALEAMREAIARLELFHKAQRPPDLRIETAPGVLCERRYLPIQRVGLYIPGGTAPLPSTVMMLGVPARIANCPLRVLVTPPRKDGSIDPHILAAAYLLDIEHIYRAGGAQAIGALAYGTESIPKVDKIFGPGNSWVTEAKVQVALDPRGAALDLPAGPSEVLVIADAQANPAFVASDLLAQAEHGPDSQVVLVSNSSSLLEAASRELESQLARLPRREIAARALESSCAILARDLDEALEISNAYAPEHLILQLATRARGRARSTRGLGVHRTLLAGVGRRLRERHQPCSAHLRFRARLRRSDDRELPQGNQLPGAERRRPAPLGPGVETLAAVEGLEGHKNAVTLRLRSLS